MLQEVDINHCQKEIVELWYATFLKKEFYEFYVVSKYLLCQYKYDEL